MRQSKRRRQLIILPSTFSIQSPNNMLSLSIFFKFHFQQMPRYLLSDSQTTISWLVAAAALDHFIYINRITSSKAEDYMQWWWEWSPAEDMSKQDPTWAWPWKHVLCELNFTQPHHSLNKHVFTVWTGLSYENMFKKCLDKASITNLPLSANINNKIPPESTTTDISTSQAGEMRCGSIPPT